jgi:hypothetical protein
MKDAEYVARLQQQLAVYKSSVLGVAGAGVWGSPPRAYPHILPIQQGELNIVAPLRERFRIEQSRQGWKLHKYFHHLSSSQALAFNLFFPIYPTVPPRMMATRRSLGLPALVDCDLRFEAVLDPKEGTNIDALVSAADGSRTIIEVKLTERTFGNAPADANHVKKLNDVYRPLLAGRLADSCLEPRAFFRDYQLYRNLAQVRPGSADRVVLLLPRARAQLWQHATSWCASPALGSLGECVSVVALEDVVAALAADSVGSESDRAVIDEVALKYMLTAG